MGIELVIAVIGVCVLVAVVLRLAAGRLDAGRIARHVTRQGGRLIGKRWAPFGKGWLGEQDARIYKVTYRDQHGNIHRATCKTRLFGGVYFAGDRIVRQAEASEIDRTQQLEQDNQLLREELERLRRQVGHEG